jgi:hypothetical protein
MNIAIILGIACMAVILILIKRFQSEINAERARYDSQLWAEIVLNDCVKDIKNAKDTYSKLRFEAVVKRSRSFMSFNDYFIYRWLPNYDDKPVFTIRATGNAIAAFEAMRMQLERLRERFKNDPLE